MAEVVDAIIAQLEVRLGNYVTGFNQAADAHERFTRTRPDKVGGFTTAEIDQYANRHRAAANDLATAEEQATAKVTRTRKARTDAIKAADREEVASADAAARERQAIADRAARAEENAARRVIDVKERLPRATGTTLGRTVPREGSGQRPIPAATLAGDTTAAAESEINHALADRATIQASVTTLKGREKQEAQDLLAAMRLENQLRTAGVAEEEILLRLEEQRGRVAARNAVAQRGQSGTARGAEQFARGAGLYAATGGAAAIAGIGTAAAVYGGTEAITSSIAFAKQISDTAAATGVSTKQIQVYQAAARQAGATNEQLAASFGRLNDYVGRAKEGDEQAAKTFNALGISLKGVGSAGDVLPTLVDRLSQIKDPAERAAVGSRLFGEEYRRLDAVLGQGTGKIDALAKSLERTGSILSGRDISTLKDASAVLGELKARLEVDLARVVTGNAAAILGLANAFANLADKALKAVQAIGRVKAQGVIDAKTDGATPEERAAARQTLIADPQGRQYLLQRNSRELRANEASAAAVRGSSALMTVNGRTMTGPQFYEQEQHRLYAERRAVLTYRDPGDITAPVQPGKTGDVSNLFAPKAPKGPKDRTPEQLAAEQAERSRQYLDRLAGLQEANLRGQQSLTGSITEQAAIERDLAARALKKQLDDIELTKQRNIARIEGERTTDANKKSAIALENAHAAELTAAAKAADATQAKVISLDEQTKLIAAQNQHLQTQLSIDAEIASTNGQLATTRKERLAAELNLLDIQKQQERASLVAQRATLKPGDPAAADIDKRLGSLDTIYAGRAAATRRGNASPLEQYRDRLKATVGDTKDALEQVEVNALGRLEDQVSSTIGKVLGLKGAFGELASSIISDLARIAIERSILGLFGGGGGGGDSLSGLAGLIGAGNGSPPPISLGGARAAGGSVVGGTTYLVGEHGPELFRAPQSGRIYPNNAPITAMGGSNLTQHITVDARNSVVPADFARQILDTADQRAKQHAARAGIAAVNASPARVRQAQTLES